MRLRELLDVARSHGMKSFVAVRFPGLRGLFEVLGVSDALRLKKVRLKEGFS
ncbi:MAG: hypothetical protein GTO29_04185 [Candidatus Latescibacteria bacterium]|nr:hypothetical protein [Candidatus Latescibacterota bacterium]NIO55276.1 hypothetical protein [Candidatus Latescibacterota bacterium]